MARTYVTVTEVKEIKRRLLGGETQAKLAKEFGVSQTYISALKLGKVRGEIPAREDNGLSPRQEAVMESLLKFDAEEIYELLEAAGLINPDGTLSVGKTPRTGYYKDEDALGKEAA